MNSYEIENTSPEMRLVKDYISRLQYDDIVEFCKDNDLEWETIQIDTVTLLSQRLKKAFPVDNSLSQRS